MTAAYVIGNGPSRQAIDLNLLRKDKGAAIFGCNAIHRDFAPDYIVAIDPKPIAELRASSFPQHRIIVPMRHEHWEPPQLHKGVPQARRSNAGVNALREAIRRDYSPIYLIGFDFLLKNAVAAVGNVYDGTPGYEMEHRAKAEDSIPRTAYLDHTLKTIGMGTDFLIVMPKEAGPMYKLTAPNVRTIYPSALVNMLKCK